MNILITAIGSFSADCVINALKKAGHYVVGCDIYPSEWHAVSKDCDVVYKAPYATNEKEYIRFLIDISIKHEIAYIFPLTDFEIDVLNKFRFDFQSHNIILCMPSMFTLAIARNKYALYKTFKGDNQVPSIQTYLSGKNNDVPDTILPAISKPYNGRSSEGLSYITSLELLHNVVMKEGYIIQEQIEGSVFTVDYVRDEKTNCSFSIAREELLRTKNGAGTTIQIINDNQLSALVSHIGISMRINGCVNMEFIKSKNKYYLIDINPRFSAGIAFSNILGYNMILSHLNCFAGGNIQSPINYKNQIITKRYKEEIIYIH